MRADQLPAGRPEQLPRLERGSCSPRSSARKPPPIPVQRAVQTWVADGKAQNFSPRTLADREGTFQRVVWWLEHVEQVEPTLEALTPERVRRFLAYVRDPNPEGRFGKDHPLSKARARPSTVATYFRDLRAFSGFCVAEGFLSASFVQNVKAPKVPFDQVQPFTEAQVQSLMEALPRSPAPDRNRAILLVLLDSGLRVSELCSLTVGDVAHDTGQLTVTGKGGKTRAVYLGVTARRALRNYVRRWRHSATAEEPLFIAEGGHHSGAGLTAWGVRSMMKDLGVAANLQGVRCSPHTARHTFAVMFLRGGGNLFELQRLMGHTDLTILRRYVALAESDLATAHRQASPADRMKLG
jgi:integrase/recombinase XerC